MWNTVSERYAAQASGQVTAFTRGYWRDAVFWKTELPALKNNPLVTGIDIISRGLK
ncbi:hypothetical protein AB0H57_14400 [Micromonospora sp. NPDC050686]|uniref:hypothetical protein n=1 Tax=Micromonospora sp. NPDC050686 TaxID=3154631 RepID=UPI0033D9CA66